MQKKFGYAPAMRWWPMLLPVLLVACGDASSETTPSTPSTDAASDAASPVDAASEETTAPAEDAATSDAVVDDVPPATDGAPACTGACATLTGSVRRKPLTKPQHGGKGNVYVAVFDRDPVIDRASAKLIGQVVVPDADMTADTASVAYTVEALPPRAEPYFVVAFLDDDHDASGTSPGPDKGDLVSLDGLSSPKVTLSSPTVKTLDLDLNAALPF